MIHLAAEPSPESFQ